MVRYHGRHIKCSRFSFTLVELLIASVVFILTLVGILLSYMKCVELNEHSRNLSIAMRGLESRFEDIKNTPFSQIKTSYNQVTFTNANLNGTGVSGVDDTNPALLRVSMSFSWRQSNGRIMGEDANLNGQLNAGEDKNGNGVLDSPAQLISYIAQ